MVKTTSRSHSRVEEKKCKRQNKSYITNLVIKFFFFYQQQQRPRLSAPFYFFHFNITGGHGSYVSHRGQGFLSDESVCERSDLKLSYEYLHHANAALFGQSLPINAIHLNIYHDQCHLLSK